VLRDPFKFSVLIGLVFAAIVAGGLSVVHWYEPASIAVQTKQ
jgi:hypothetical protein